MNARVVIWILVIAVSAFAVTGSDIAASESTKPTFGQYYEPYELNFEPNAPGYTLPLDLNDIANFYDVNRVIEINTVSKLIQKNGFAIVEPGLYSNVSCLDFDSFYLSLDRLRIPAFVTVDTGLYLYDTVLDDVLKSIEDPALRSKIWDLKKQPLNVGMFGNDSYTRGLELMARLGSDEAEKILIDEGNIDSELHKLRPEKFEKDIHTLDRLDGQINLYWT